MPRGRPSPTLEQIAQQEDSNDDDYDDRAPGPAKAKPSRRSRGTSKVVRKKIKRVRYSGSDIESDDEDIDSDDDAPPSSEASKEEPVTNSETGRPVRNSAKKLVTYEEEGSEDEDELARTSSSSEEEETPEPAKPRRSLKVTLPVIWTPQRPARSLRTRSGSYGAKQPASTTPAFQTMRRSSRLSHDPEESLVGLTNSGNHVEVTKQGSHDPEDIPPRAIRGGKGIKGPLKSTIDEDEEPDSIATKQEEMDEPEIKASQHEILESDPQTQQTQQEEAEEDLVRLVSDLQEAAGEDNESPDPIQRSQPLPDEAEGDDAGGSNEDDDDPVRGRALRSFSKRKADSPAPEPSPRSKRQKKLEGLANARNTSVPSSRTLGAKKAHAESSDFELSGSEAREAEMTDSDDEHEDESPRKAQTPRRPDHDSAAGRRSTRLRSKVNSQQSNEDEEDLEAEVQALKGNKRPRRRRLSDEIVMEETRGRRRGGQKPNYDLMKGFMPLEEEDDQPAEQPQRGSRRSKVPGSWARNLLSTQGPFGGAGGPAPILGALPRAQGDVDSDSSDDEAARPPRPIGGTVGMTPTAAGTFNFFPPPQNADPAQAVGGTPANLGKIKDKQALADADPLGVDQHVNFDSVGGLQGHVDQLTEMITLPLLYPEIFMNFKITPPRGVLFHGPPGTGKTLLARALANSVSSQGKKVTFYMRKGADALSKWVGEAERQLRLLFDEARKTQPSIIFFDEIDGLAPVRSSKQEQIHASIVSTLLALMDGMDGRGQVVVIGATNRPDSIDPALRRPGRFDREFYFPLPNTEARRAILDIHTRGWTPPIPTAVKVELAELTKGYGGADLRALCTESALNAVQRHYPQIYASKQKLLIDPKTIHVTPKDFMISIKKMVPSSERAAASGAAPLPSNLVPLLQRPLADIKSILAELMPHEKRLTALEEAQYEDNADGNVFGRERMQQAFESSRVFRPRLLIHGRLGMGQQYLSSAILNHFEGFHVQSFDLPTLLSDTTASPESTVIRLFSEVKQHKPSVIYLPNVQDWYATVGQTVTTTFINLLRQLKAADQVLVLGVLESDAQIVDESMKRELFPYTKKNLYQLQQPSNEERFEFFSPLANYLRTSPSDFPDPASRKKRVIEKLPPAPDAPEKPAPPPTKEEQKSQKRRDRQTLNMLKISLQPIMDQIKLRHRAFRTPVIAESDLRYLYDEADPGTLTSDVAHAHIGHSTATFRPYEVGKDAHGTLGLVEQASGKFYYNMETDTIEKRLSNGYYKRPKDYLADIKKLAKDWRAAGDDKKLLAANELLANVEVDIGRVELENPGLTAEYERVYEREVEREKKMQEQAKADAEANNEMQPPAPMGNVPHEGPSSLTLAIDGPVVLGEPTHRKMDMLSRFQPVTPSKPPSGSSAITNGVHHTNSNEVSEPMTNGTTSNDGHEADVEMEGTDSRPTTEERSNETQRTHTTSSFGKTSSAQPRPFASYTAPSQQLRKEHNASEPISQTGALTPVPRGSNVADFLNEASTTQTTSGQKNNSEPSTGERNQQNTHGSGPGIWGYDDAHSDRGTEIPDTQGMLPQIQRLRRTRQFTQERNYLTAATGYLPYSQGNVSQPAAASQGPDRSSQPPVPLFDEINRAPHSQERRNSQLRDILNPEPQPNLTLPDETRLKNFHQDVADRTSGLAIEQLEQVNSALMDTVWKTRGEWERGKVLDAVGVAFNGVMKDMSEVGQDFGPSSWGKSTQDTTAST